MTQKFELIEQDVQFANLNLRRQKHGERFAPAADITVMITTHNGFLDRFDEGLVDMFYTDDLPETDQATRDLVGSTNKAHLRTSKLAKPVELKTELVGAKVTIPFGLDEKIELHDAKLNTFRVDFKEGGTVVVTFRLQSEVDPDDTGKLFHLWLGGDVTFSCVAAQRELPLDDDDHDDDDDD